VEIRHPSHQSFDKPKPSQPTPSTRKDNNANADKNADNNADKNAANRPLEDHIGKLNWLKENAKRNGEPLTQFAKAMGMSIYLENKAVLLHWLSFHAKQACKTVQELAESIGINCPVLSQ